MTQDPGPQPIDTIISALQIARERVVSDTIEAKLERHDALQRAIDQMFLRKDTGQGGPSAQELRDLLGDPGDAYLRHALEAYASAVGE